MAETRLTPQIVYTGRLEGLEGGRTYQIDLVDAFRDEVLASALVAPERKIAPSPNTHVLDGLFTVQVGEWAHIEPVWGRFTFLFADFDGECLHLINDWHVCRERINDWDCNKIPPDNMVGKQRRRKALLAHKSVSRRPGYGFAQ